MKKILLVLLTATIFTGSTKSATITIPANVMKSSFGKTHSFMLKTHGPNPVFSRAGYTFRVETYGYELSDQYYYKVPVYVDYDVLNKQYRLYSTVGEGYSVQVIVLATLLKA